jgi:hypothetical protein
LYDHKDQDRANAEIHAALKSKNIEKIASTVKKWRHLGAEDTTSRDEITIAFGKMGGDSKKLSEIL